MPVVGWPGAEAVEEVTNCRCMKPLQEAKREEASIVSSGLYLCLRAAILNYTLNQPEWMRERPKSARLAIQSVAIANGSQYTHLMQSKSTFPLNQLAKGQIARVFGFDADEHSLVAKLREIGFAEGDEVELMGRGWLGGAPLSIRLNRTLIALRKREAALVHVEPV